MKPLENEPLPTVYFWPDTIDDDPLITPVSATEAVDLAIDAVTRAFPAVDYTDIYSAEITGSEPVQAHKFLLWLLDKTSIEYRTLADELGYESEESLEQEIEKSTEFIDELIRVDGSAHNSSEIVRGRYAQFLGQIAIEQKPAATVEPQRQPALYGQDLALFESARDEDADAIAALEQRYEADVNELIYNVDHDNPPAEIIDEAWAVFDDHLRTADLASPIDFKISLRSRIEAKMAEVIEQHAVQELTRDLNMRDYLKEIDEFGASLNKEKIKSSLDPATLQEEVAYARSYLMGRLAKGTAQPIKGYFRNRPEVRPELAGRIRRSFEKSLIRNLKLSALMKEQGGKDFHLAQLSEEQKVKFLAITLGDTASTEIERFKKYQRRG